VSSFVLVPGACHGGWWYEPLVEELERRGHRARALTLAGLEPDGVAGAGLVNLDSQVEEATAGPRSGPHFSGAVALVFALLTATFILLTIGAFQKDTSITKIGGYLGLASAAAAWYASWAGVLNETWKRTVLPVFAAKPRA